MAKKKKASATRATMAKAKKPARKTTAKSSKPARPVKAKKTVKVAKKKPVAGKGEAKPVVKKNMVAKKTTAKKTKPVARKAALRSTGKKTAAKPVRKAAAHQTKTGPAKKAAVKKVTVKSATGRHAPAKPVVPKAKQLVKKAPAKPQAKPAINQIATKPAIAAGGSKKASSHNVVVKTSAVPVKKETPAPKPVKQPVTQAKPAPAPPSQAPRKPAPTPKPAKERVQIEFMVRSAPTVLYELISTPSGFSEWYCIDVNVRGDQYTFVWEGGEEEATTMIGRKIGEVIRFHRNNDEDPLSFFEFRIRIDAMTNEVALIVTDHAWPAEVEATRNLWTSQIASLLRVLGA